MPLKTKPLPDVPRWAVRAAYAVPLVTLPSGLWRLALVAGLPVLGNAESEGFRSDWEPLYVISLSVVSELLALLTLGLISAWGEVVPHWVPLIGGRAIRPMGAVVPAVLGATGLFGIYGWYVYANIFTDLAPGITGTPLQEAILLVCYLPLLAWAPLLLAVTFAYYRRRVPAARSAAPVG
ncbi:hypothetical protein OG897_15090 [Streptomyces sp. NBC_00237]|uniref:hypothetical protein n=1 Tax=Streptomyces sp. NBC_00237 TaxID=2975687 RepID=UPI00224F4350|nr:hypothetical protein [Streptomyces sp. NBC_00237]MCX5202770.1 hypothetical protein [Streptomyces sp. NBC_00237]